MLTYIRHTAHRGPRACELIGVAWLVALLAVGVTSALAEVNREAITSYDRMQPGAPYHGYFNNAWQGFVAQSSVITHIGVTVGNPTLPAGGAVAYSVAIKLCTSQPDTNGNCASILAQGNPQIINYGNSSVDVGDVAVTQGQMYWVVWYQPPAVSGTTWVTFWWAGGSTIGESDQMQMTVSGYDPVAGSSAPPNEGAGMPPPSPPPPPIPPVAHSYAIANVASVNIRSGPGTTFPAIGSLSGGAPIDIVCQTVGSSVNGSSIWDQLTSGSYVSDWYTTTPVVGDYSPGIPHCAGAPDPPAPPASMGQWAIVASTAITLRSGPGTQYGVAGSLGPGEHFDITCQTYGSIVAGSPVWDRLPSGQYVSDFFTNTPVYAMFSPGLAVCPGTGGPPSDSSGGSSSGSSPGGGGVVAGGPSSCAQDLVFIGARGSGEGTNGFGSTVWVTVGHVTNRFGSRVRLDGLDYEYPAMPILSWYTFTHFGDYLDSVRRGTQAVLSHMQYDLSHWPSPCHPLRFVLAGFSQGAWVVGDAILAMSRAWRDDISGVVLLGDPRNPGTPLVHGVWDSGHVFPADIQSRIKNYCHFADPVCNATALDAAQLVVAAGQHASYRNSGDDADQGGAFLVDRLGG